MSVGSFFLYLLKWIALIVMIILALMLVTVILLLFSPFNYKVIVKKDEILSVKANLCWCLGILSAKCIYSDEKDTKIKINILGIPINFWSRIFSLFSIFKNKTKKSKKKEKKDLPISPDSQTYDNNTMNISENEDKNHDVYIEDSLDESDTEGFSYSNDESDADDKKGKIFNRINSFKEKFTNIRAKTREVSKKVSSVISVLKKNGSKEGIVEVLTSGKKIIKSILPRKIRGMVRFGMEDPYKMGQVLSVLGITYSLYGKNVTVIPEFDCQDYIEGDLYIKGKIKIFTILKICIKLYMNEKFKKLMENYKMTD